MIFTAIVCYGLRAAETSLLGEPKIAHTENSAHVETTEPEDLHVDEAKFVKSLPFPFEVVHDTWENGPADENLIRADVEVSHSGSEEVKRKMIYTKNPLPYILRKTIVREDQFIFQEEQHIDMRKKYSRLWSINRSFEDTVQARRTFVLREDPHKKGHTIMEQSLRVSISSSLGGAAIQKQLEKISRNTFLSGCEKSFADLEKTLAARSTAPADLHLRNPHAQPLDSLEDAIVSAEHSMRRQTLRKTAERIIHRGLLLAGAALRVWAHVKAPHHTCPRESEPGHCVNPTLEAEQEQQDVKQPTMQSPPQAEKPQHGLRRNPIKRMMSVAAAAFVSV